MNIGLTNTLPLRLYPMTGHRLLRMQVCPAIILLRMRMLVLSIRWDVPYTHVVSHHVHHGTLYQANVACT